MKTKQRGRLGSNEDRVRRVLGLKDEMGKHACKLKL